MWEIVGEVSPALFVVLAAFWLVPMGSRGSIHNRTKAMLMARAAYDGPDKRARKKRMVVYDASEAAEQAAYEARKTARQGMRSRWEQAWYDAGGLDNEMRENWKPWTGPNVAVDYYTNTDQYYNYKVTEPVIGSFTDELQGEPGHTYLAGRNVRATHHFPGHCALCQSKGSTVETSVKQESEKTAKNAKAKNGNIKGGVVIGTVTMQDDVGNQVYKVDQRLLLSADIAVLRSDLEPYAEGYGKPSASIVKKATDLGSLLQMRGDKVPLWVSLLAGGQSPREVHDLLDDQYERLTDHDKKMLNALEKELDAL